MKRVSNWLLMPLLIWGSVGLAEQSFKPMPPTFAFENHPADILKNYPLGVIRKQDAFAHHGGAIHKVTLPNGNLGWLYKAGEKAGVPSIYILEFSSDDIVIDVLHKDHRYKIGHSALQYQYLQHIEAELRTFGPGPGK